MPKLRKFKRKKGNLVIEIILLIPVIFMVLWLLLSEVSFVNTQIELEKKSTLVMRYLLDEKSGGIAIGNQALDKLKFYGLIPQDETNPNKYVTVWVYREDANDGQGGYVIDVDFLNRPRFNDEENFIIEINLTKHTPFYNNIFQIGEGQIFRTITRSNIRGMHVGEKP